MTGVLSEGSRTVNNVEKETAIELLARTVHFHLERHLRRFLVFNDIDTRDPEIKAKDLEMDLNSWRRRSKKCAIRRTDDYLICLPCLVTKNRAHHGPGNDLSEEQCVISTNVKELLNELKVDQIGNICKLFARVLTESVCTNTINSDLGEELRTITPPWGVMGLGYSLREFSFTKENYLTHHAAGTLADQLVRRGLLDAATAGKEDQRTQGEADQQTKSVDTKAK